MGWPLSIIIGDKKLRERLREAQRAIRNFHRHEKPELEHQLGTAQKRIGNLEAELVARPTQEDLIGAKEEIGRLEARLWKQQEEAQNNLKQLQAKSETEKATAIRQLQDAGRMQLQAQSEESVRQIRHILDVYFSTLRMYQEQANSILKDLFIDDSSIAFAPQENPIWAALIERVRIIRRNDSRPFYIFVPRASLTQYLGLVPSRAKLFIAGMTFSIPEDPEDFKYSRLLKYSIEIVADGVQSGKHNMEIYTPEVYLGEKIKQRDDSYLRLIELARCVDNNSPDSEESNLLSYVFRHGLTQGQSLALILHLGTEGALDTFERLDELKSYAHMVQLKEKYGVEQLSS